MAESQDVNTLRRRGRRRLVGAIALVLLAAIVLPMVFDPEPAPNAPPVNLRIPAEDGSGFTPKVTPRPATSPVPVPDHAAPKAAQEQGAPKAAQEQGAPKAAQEQGARRTPQEAPKPAAVMPKGAATAPAQPSEQFIVPVAALSSQVKVKDLLARLKAAKLPYYTEPLATAAGSVTRVRVGPYADREAAEQAQRELQRLGFKPGKVLAKP